MSEEKGARSVARGSLSVAASPLNGVKFELGVILFVGLLLVPVAGRLFADPLWQVLALAVYGCAGALWLVLRGQGGQRTIGWLMLVGQSVKLLVEQPWGAAIHPPTELDVAVAPLAHASGSIAGALCTALALWLTRAPRA